MSSFSFSGMPIKAFLKHYKRRPDFFSRQKRASERERERERTEKNSFRVVVSLWTSRVEIKWVRNDFPLLLLALTVGRRRSSPYVRRKSPQSQIYWKVFLNRKNTFAAVSCRAVVPGRFTLPEEASDWTRASNIIVIDDLIIIIIIVTVTSAAWTTRKKRERERMRKHVFYCELRRASFPQN